MKRALLLLGLVACRTTAGPGVEVLPPPRSPAEAMQEVGGLEDPFLAAQIAWIEGQDRATALARIEASLGTAENKPQLLLLRALIRLDGLDQTGALADLLTLAADPGPPEAEAALLLLHQHQDAYARSRAEIKATLASYLDPTRPAPSGRTTLATLLIAELDAKDQAHPNGEAALGRGGWLTTCRGMGPLAPAVDAAFAEPTPYELGNRAWSTSDLFRGFQPPIRALRHFAGSLSYASGERPGLYVIECAFELTSSQDIELEAHLDGPGRVRIDGEEVVSRLLWRERGRRIGRARLHLPAGWHRLTAALTGGSEARPRFSILGPNGAPVISRTAADLPQGSRRPVGTPVIDREARIGPALLSTMLARLVADPRTTLYGRILGAAIDGTKPRDDLDRARAYLEPAIDAGLRSAALFAAWSTVLRVADHTDGAAEGAAREGLLLDRTHPGLLLTLAESALHESPEKALEALGKAKVVAPTSARVHALEFRAYRAKGWNVEAVASLRLAAEHGASAPLLLEGAELLRSLDRNGEAELLEKVALVDSPEETWHRTAESALRRGDLDAAIAAHERGVGGPSGLLHLVRIAEIESSRSRPKQAEAAALRAIVRDPLLGRAWRQLLYARILEQDVSGAKEALDRLVLLGESDLATEAMASTLIGGGPERPDLSDELTAKLAYDPWPQVRYLPNTKTPRGLDPADRWSRYKAVQLLDQVVDLVRPGGQVLSFRHSVTRLQTKEATDQSGELNLPAEALPLLLRTLKPDGRVIDIDRHSGKDDLSFSALAPGDAIEKKWVSLEGAATPWGGYLRQFYFRTTTPLTRSELVVVVPKGAKIWTMSYHGAPEPTVTEEMDRTVYHFRADDVLPMEPEPAAVEHDEYLPFVIVAVNLSAETALWTNGLGLERLLQGSASVARAAVELTRLAPTDEAKAKEIFRFVTQEISYGETREPAAVLASRRGNRSGLYAALLTAAGIPSDLVLARAGDEARVIPPFPDTGRYDTELVRARLGDGRSIWAMVDDRRPWFGLVAPSLRGGDFVVFDGLGLGRSYELPPNEIDSWPLGSIVDLDVDTSGMAKGRVSLELPGTFGSEIREFLETAREEDVDRQMQSWVAALIPGAVLIDLSTENRDQLFSPLILRAQIEVEHFMVRDGDHLIAEQFFGAPLALQSLGLPTLGAYLRLPRRESPLMIHELAEHMEIRVRLPVGVQAPIEAPAGFVRQAAYGRFAQQFSYDPARREAVLVADQQMPMLRLLPEAVPAFVTGAQEILQASRNRLVVPLLAPSARRAP